MNPYFQVIINDSGTFLKLIPGDGGLPSIQETMNYLDAKKYYNSLKAVLPDWKSEKYTYSQIEALASKDIPGFVKNTVLIPKS